jgi:hypothetical protein
MVMFGWPGTGMAALGRTRIPSRVRHAALAMTAMRRGRWWSCGFSDLRRSASRVCVRAGHAKQRSVLAVLVLGQSRAVPAELLIDRVWGADPPTSVRNIL